MGVSQTPTLKNSVKSQKGQPRYLGCFSCSGANAPLHLWCDGAHMFFTHTCVCVIETARPPRARAGSLVSPSKPTKFPLAIYIQRQKGCKPWKWSGNWTYLPTVALLDQPNSFSQNSLNRLLKVLRVHSEFGFTLDFFSNCSKYVI